MKELEELDVAFEELKKELRALRQAQEEANATALGCLATIERIKLLQSKRYE